MEKNLKSIYTYIFNIYIILNHFVIHPKHCKSTLTEKTNTPKSYHHDSISLTSSGEQGGPSIELCAQSLKISTCTCHHVTAWLYGLESQGETIINEYTK